MWPPWWCGPGSGSSVGGITGAPVRAAWRATWSSRTTSCGSGPSGNGRLLETRATTGAGARWTRTCHAARRTTGCSHRTPCALATAAAAETALSELTAAILPDVRFEGFHGRAGMGEKPALIVVDVNRGFTDPASPLVCDLDECVAEIVRLLEAFRRAELPVVFTTVCYDDFGKQAAAVFLEKIPALLVLEPGSPWVEIDPRIAPEEAEPVLSKYFASAFFGTTLASVLASAGADTVVVTGASTSGCVRATALDALQHGYRAVVPREAVGDRNADAHEANLYDLDTKYADVVSVEDVLAELAVRA